MLLIFHADKNDTASEVFFDEELSIEFQEEFGENVWVKLKMVGYSNEDEGGPVYLDFPDLLSNQIEEEEVKSSVELFSQPGVLSLAPNEGVFYKASGAQVGYGRFYGQSDNVDLDLMLGRVHPDRNKFRIIVNARRGNDLYPTRNSLNNISCVLELVHGSEMS